jgi:hypothetical protein
VGSHICIELGCCAEGSELSSLINHVMQLLLALGNSTELSPSINVQEVVISCINGTGDRIISIKEQDKDQDNGWTDWPEPHILLPMPQTATGESSAKQHWFLCNVQFSVKSFLSLCEEAVIIHCRM